MVTAANARAVRGAGERRVPERKRRMRPGDPGGADMRTAADPFTGRGNGPVMISQAAQEHRTLLPSSDMRPMVKRE
ncbi:hypothetical protein GCM10023196_079710 [Actinoallomurus vinaceus]|uniref:Uncharacterized protein n=1 Tax=Actinoallomurus vinaceus TaxID=1080074 RepID=A0ABP8UP02_9ACTN